MRRIIKLSKVILHLFAGLFTLLALRLKHRGPVPDKRLKRHRQQWHLKLTRILDLHIQRHGLASEHPALLVSNHVSWMDIPVLGSQGELGFLSKAEVRDWLGIGWLADRSGTLFIERGGSEAAEKAMDDIREQLNGQHNIILFPEGTTTDGSDVRRFHPRLFATAFALNVPVQPVAIRYTDDHGNPHHGAPFIGDDTFPAHIWRIAKEKRIHVDVYFLPPIPIDDSLKRRELAESAHQAIRSALQLPEAA